MSHILIVGGSSGIGETLVTQLIDQGHKVTTICRTQPKIPVYEHHSIDVTRDELPVLTNRYDGLVYCPGSINLKPFVNLTETDFRQDMEINFFAAVNIIQKYITLLQNDKPSSIVVFSTVAVRKGMSFHASTAACKGALEAFAISLAAEYAPKVRINVIAPSLTETPLSQSLMRSRDVIEKRHPMKRLGTTDDIANTATFLLSEKSGWITGQIIGVDGGMSSLSMN
jgi:3-oxoacyl-[acyl-carrier protein] reductase